MKRILFVDDDRNILDGLSRMFHAQRNEWQLAFAQNVSQAIDLLRADPFDIVVSDIRMPGMNGSNLLQVVQMSFPNVLRIVLSGYFEREATLEAAGLAHDYIAKPCTVEKLRGAIDRLLRAASVLTDESARRVVGAIGSLPSLGRGAATLLAALQRPETRIEDIGGLTEEEPGVRTRLRQLRRSPQSALSEEATANHTEIAQAGLDARLENVLWAEILSAFQPELGAAEASLEDLGRHCLLAARIAAMLPANNETRNVGVLSALLHDIGKLVLALRLPEQFERASQQSREQDRPLYEVEQEFMGTSHAEIGAYILSFWGMSRPLVDAVARHHHTSADDDFGPELDPLAMTRMADALARGRDPRISASGSARWSRT
jgi:putative nucleotidyltransferase with HDIG domain